MVWTPRVVDPAACTVWSSVLTSGVDWGDEVTTIYDLWKKQAAAFIDEFDCDGIIFSEFVSSYLYTFAEKDLALYNAWRTAHSLAPLAAWPTDPDGKCTVDDSTLWDWKCWQTEKAMAELGPYVRALGALFGMSAEVEPVISIQNPNASVWNGYTKAQDKDGAWHVRELAQNCRRYGQDYRRILASGRCDFLYCWPYYRYCPPSWFDGIVDDFAAEYSDLRDRLLVCIGAYPSADPPKSAEEIQAAMLKLLNSGYQVAYAGHPRIWEWPVYDSMWPWLRSYTPLVRLADDGIIELDRKNCSALPFYIRGV